MSALGELRWQWVRAAMRHLKVEHVAEDGSDYYLGTVRGCRGAWMHRDTEREVRMQFPFLLYDWAHSHPLLDLGAFPVFGGINLNPRTDSASQCQWTTNADFLLGDPWHFADMSHISEEDE